MTGTRGERPGPAGAVGPELDLTTFSLSEMVTVGRRLRAVIREASEADDAAARVVRWLYDNLRGPDGERACALVRFFRTRTFESLDPEEREFALRHLEGGVTEPWMRCLALVATAGDEPEWNDPRTSQGHRALPLPSPKVVERSPMLSRLMHQFGVDVASLTSGGGDVLLHSDQGAFNVFHVEDAKGSPYLPAQQDFVEPYGIRSALGFGATLPTGDLFAVILFSRVRVTAEVAERFETLALNTKVALLPFEAGPDTEGFIDANTAELEAVKDLLDVHERVVGAQSEDLEHRSRVLRSLNEAAHQVHSLRNVDEVLDCLVAKAREIIGAHQGVASLTIDHNWAQSITSVDLSERYAEWRDFEAPPDGSGIYSEVCRTNEPMRLTQEELESHPGWRSFGEYADRHPPMRGWLAAPLVARDGSNLGLIQLSDRDEGEFTEDDEQTLLQLARIGSLALENVQLAERQALGEAERFREELLAGISHDMKTPVTAVVGLTEVLLEEGGDLTLEEQRDVLEAMLRQGRALQGLVFQFLDYARLEAGRELAVAPRPVEVGQVASEAIRLFEHIRTIEVAIPDGLDPVLADPDRLRQILTNLLSNASKFSPTETPIRIAVEREESEVRIWVEDRGAGLEPEETLHLFEKFYRGSNTDNVSGSGLGLYISKVLAEAMGGRMLVDTQHSPGSRFGVALPTAEHR